MFSKLKIAAMAGIMIFGLAGTSNAAMVLDAGWNIDTFTAIGSTNDSLSPVAEGYDFTLSTSAVLTITDCCSAGDTFDVYDGAALLTSSALLSGVAFGDGLGAFPAILDAALVNGALHGVQLLFGPGSYNLRILMTAVAGGVPGDLGTRIDAVPVPEPATLAIFGVGLAGLGFMRRRRKLVRA